MERKIARRQYVAVLFQTTVDCAPWEDVLLSLPLRFCFRESGLGDDFHILNTTPSLALRRIAIWCSAGFDCKKCPSPSTPDQFIFASTRSLSPPVQVECIRKMCCNVRMSTEDCLTRGKRSSDISRRQGMRHNVFPNNNHHAQLSYIRVEANDCDALQTYSHNVVIFAFVAVQYSSQRC